MSAPSFLLIGKNPGHLQACIDGAKPDFEVAKTATSVEDAKAAIKDLGPKISFVVMGGGFTNDDFQQVRSEAENVPWFRPKTTKPGYDGPMPQGAPPPETVSSWLRTALNDHAGELKEGKGAGEIWYF